MADKRDAPPIRSFLFVPGSEADEVRRAEQHGADAVVIDMEEPRTPYSEEDRDRTRHSLREFFAGSIAGGGPRWFVRVQAPESGQTLKDLRAVCGPALAGVLLPKVRGPQDVYRLEGLLNCIEVEAGLPLGYIGIYPILETAEALRTAYDIAIASTRVQYMGGAISRFGDIYQALGFHVTAGGSETLFLRSKVLLDARAAGVRYPVSGMWCGDTDDLDGLRDWAAELRNLGYYGMLLSEPSHVPVVNEVFTPTADQVNYWKDLDRLERQASGGDGNRVLYGDPNSGEGHVVHPAHVGSARMNLEWARGLGIDA